MKDKFYTVMIVPHKTSRIKRIKIPVIFIQIAGIIGLLSLLITGFMIFDYFNIRLKTIEVSKLREETKRQKIQIQSFATIVSNLQSQVMRIKQFEAKLRKMVNSKDTVAVSRNIGVGGPSEEDIGRVSQIEKRQALLIKRMNSDIENLQKEVSIREKSIQELLEFFEDQKSIMTSTPSIWPSRGWVTSPFGYRTSPFSGDRQFHNGIDIATNFASPVISPADGMVSYIGNEGGYGRIVIIDHGYGFVTRYGHLSNIFVKIGQKVKRGEKIASVGRTGKTTGSHVHYEVWLSGVPVNPRKFMKN